MKVNSKALLMIVAYCTLSACTKSIDIKLEFMGKIPVFTFYHKNLFTTSRVSPCIWNFQIIDDQKRAAVITLGNSEQCIVTDKINLANAIPGLHRKGGLKNLKVGRTYHAELIAEGGVGSSSIWRQK